MKSIFEFIDYRKFLEHYYQEQKKAWKGFSYRYFAMKAGINSPSFLKHVIDGKRNLTRPVIDKFCTACKFTNKEASYFKNLVLFNQADTSSEKQEHYAVLRTMQGLVKEEVLNTNLFDYFNKWYTVVIRELVCIHNFHDNYQDLARSLIPPIIPSEAKTAVGLLLKLKLIAKNDDGSFVQTNTALVADNTITSMAVRSFTDTMIQHARSALHIFGKSERHISGITLGVSKPCYDILVAEIEAFKDRIKMIVNRDDNPSRVYQLNIECFPLTIEFSENENMKDKDD